MLSRNRFGGGEQHKSSHQPSTIEVRESAIDFLSRCHKYKSLRVDENGNIFLLL